MFISTSSFYRVRPGMYRSEAGYQIERRDYDRWVLSIGKTYIADAETKRELVKLSRKVQRNGLGVSYGY